MKKIVLTICAAAFMIMPASAATWIAADRVAPVGEVMVKKNNLPAALTFKVVNGAADNSATHTTNIVQISSTDLTYAGNDNEVAAVIGTELGQIINGKSSKDKIRKAAKQAIKERLSENNIITTAANSEFVANTATLNDLKLADMTAVDLMINAGYNPLALVVTTTKMPGSNIEIALGKPSNSERAMSAYNYITYNYADKIKSGYNCQEYRNFLAYADPIVQKRNSKKRLLKKYNKEQELIKRERAKTLNQYKMSGGMSGWEATYTILNELSNTK